MKGEDEVRVLAIGAHFDDVELGCGGTLLRHVANGDDVNILVVSKSDYVSKNTSHIREEETALSEGIKSANMMQANLITGTFKTLELEASKELVNFLCENVQKVNPQIVYTHFTGDQHLDHQAIAKSSLIATRWVKKVVAYVSNVYDTSPIFSPNYFVDISNEFEKKMELIECFESEKETHPNWRRQLECFNGLYGIKIGRRFAEPFEIIRIVEEETS